MAVTASADGLGVGGKRHILIRLQGPLCDFGAGAFKEARAASQGGATGDLHLPPGHCISPEPTPGISFLWETLIKPLGPVVQSQGQELSDF